jgi:PAS domain-containing protein
MAPYLHGLALAASLLLAWRVSRARASAARGWFLVFVASVAWWALCATLAVVGGDAGWYLGWWRLAFVGTAAAPVAWYAFVDAATRPRAPRRRLVLALSVVPACTVLLALLEGRPGALIVGAAEVGDAFGLLRGPWYWFVHLPYTYGLLAAGGLRAYRFARGASPAVRRQMGLLLLALALPVLGNLLDRSGLLPAAGLDLTVVAFTGAALVAARSGALGRLLEVPPGAYRAALEEVDRAVLIIDAEHVVMDANRAATERFDLELEREPVRLGRILPSVASALRRLPPDGGEIEVMVPRLPSRHAVVQVRPLRHGAGEPYGYVIVLRAVPPPPPADGPAPDVERPHAPGRGSDGAKRGRGRGRR